MKPPRVAIVDGASFVLPYDQGLVSGLARRGWQVSLFASATRYNEEFLQALQGEPGVQVQVQAVSRSTGVPTWRGVLGYARLLARLWRQRREWAAVNLQFSVLWPLELPLLWLLRRRFVFTVHNAVPHGFAGVQHRATRWLATLAARLVFASEATRDDFMRRYGAQYAAKSAVLPIGLLPLVPDEAAVAPLPRPAPQALVFWSTVKPYKGVELMRELALARTGLALEVWGTWSAELQPLQHELRALGVRVEDRFLDAATLRALMARNVVFLLPYHEASQSAALYTLLNQGCTFLCTDTGDLGAFMRRFGLQALLLQRRDAASVQACLQHLRQHADAVRARLAAAQQQCQWTQALAGAEHAYGLNP